MRTNIFLLFALLFLCSCESQKKYSPEEVSVYVLNSHGGIGDGRISYSMAFKGDELFVVESEFGHFSKAKHYRMKPLTESIKKHVAKLLKLEADSWPPYVPEGWPRFSRYTIPKDRKLPGLCDHFEDGNSVLEELFDGIKSEACTEANLTTEVPDWIMNEPRLVNYFVHANEVDSEDEKKGQIPMSRGEGTGYRWHLVEEAK